MKKGVIYKLSFQLIKAERENKTGVCLCVCVPLRVFSPINPFVVVIGIEELDLLISLWTGEVTRDGGMHE